MNRRQWWWILALTHAVVAFVSGAFVLAHSLEFWRPCYTTGFNSSVCLSLQDNDTGPGPSPGRLYVPWLVTLGAATVLWTLAAFARRREGLAWAAAATLVVLFVGNPVANYILTPFFNGGYSSHDKHPGLGIPVAVSLLASGLFALIGALRRPKAVPPGPSPVTTVISRSR